MRLNAAEIEEKIEKRISTLEQEKSRLKEDLRVVRQASIIADELVAAQSNSEQESNNPHEEHF